MFSSGLFHPHQSLHGTIHTDTAKISQEALQVGTQFLNRHWGRAGRKGDIAEKMAPMKQFFFVT